MTVNHSGNSFVGSSPSTTTMSIQKHKGAIYQKVEASVLVDLIISELTNGEVSDEIYAKIATLLVGYPVKLEPDGQFEIQWGKR